MSRSCCCAGSWWASAYQLKSRWRRQRRSYRWRS